MSVPIYIDLGANHGETIESYLKTCPDAVVFGFEANPRLAEKLLEKFSFGKKPIFIMDAACWIKDGHDKFYIGNDYSSTMIEGKRHSPTYPQFDIDYKNHVIVRTVDFSRWMLENFSFCQDICVKMDIEGAEYKVLQRLLDTGAIKMISELRCEWHWNRYPISKEEHNRIRDEVAKVVKLVDWG